MITPAVKKLVELAEGFEEKKLVQLMNSLMGGLIILDHMLERKYPEAHKKWHEDNT